MSITTTFPPISGGSGGGISGSEVPSYEINYVEVNTYADLPAANTQPNEVYIVKQDSGTWLLGSKKKSGLYYSNGVTWSFMGNSVSIDDTSTSNESVWSSGKTNTVLGGKADSTHNHVGVYEPIDSSILRSANIGSTVQAYNANTTLQGNSFNSANQLVKLTNDGKLPAIDGSALTNLPSSGVTDHTQLSNIGTNSHTAIDTALARLANTSGTNTGDQDLSGYSLTSHTHSGVYEPVDINILRTSAIGSSVQGYDANTAKTNAIQTFSAAQRGAVSTVTYAANVTLNLATSNNFEITMTGNLVLENPTNVVPGQFGKIKLVQDATGGRAVAWGTYFKFAGGTLPTYVTSANSRSGYYYSVESATEIVLSPIVDWK